MQKSSKALWLVAATAAFLVLALVLYFDFRQPPKRPTVSRAPARVQRPEGLAGNGGFPWDNGDNLIVNGSFEEPQVPPMKPGENAKVLWMMADSDEMKPWETDLDGFEIWANGLMMPRGNATVRIAPVKSAVGNQNIEIISDPVKGNGMIGSVWQTVKTKPGTTYALSFYHSERPGAKSTLTVLINDKPLTTIDEDGTDYGTLYWELFQTNFVADSASTTVKFSDESDVLGQGTHLDGVKLVEE
jgi:Protein of unknown function (DUF642)